MYIQCRLHLEKSSTGQKDGRLAQIAFRVMIDVRFRAFIPVHAPSEKHVNPKS